MSFEDIIKECVKIGIKETKKEKNMKILEDDILSPLIDVILEKIKPYVIATSIFLITITLLVMCVLYLILTTNSKSFNNVDLLKN